MTKTIGKFPYTETVEFCHACAKDVYKYYVKKHCPHCDAFMLACFDDVDVNKSLAIIERDRGWVILAGLFGAFMFVMGALIW